MKYDLEKTFCFVKNDDEWVKKLLIGAGLIVLTIALFITPLIFIIALKPLRESFAIFLFCWLVGSIVGLGITGFGYQAAHDYLKNPETKMPEWGNFKSLVFVGFKAFLGSILFYLPVIFVAIIAGSLEIASKGKTASSSIVLASIIVNIFYQVLNMFYMLIFLVFNANFIKEFNMFDFVNYVKAYKLLKGNVMNYVVLVLIVFALAMLFNIGAILLCLTIIGIILIPVGAIYIQIISSVLIARFVQITQEPKV